ncbi:hypothetical protein M407DRAFT_103870 [Tulasnella calospora MUT 4182]|uniref:Uncharacterized protein n=1 Tax=Tulasnella calospora MUT 4182 TaxID=1051891 RepID=A0A0C3Q4Y5_9AGAM|nr:hypothetical protein M407DRAFT_103870 [Tulasnella calospora MUT 4182]
MERVHSALAVLTVFRGLTCPCGGTLSLQERSMVVSHRASIAKLRKRPSKPPF